MDKIDLLFYLGLIPILLNVYLIVEYLGGIFIFLYLIFVSCFSYIMAEINNEWTEKNARSNN